MDNLFDKIKSYFISNYIFNYIKDDIFRLKLFIYSKHFQNKLNLKVLFKEQYLKKNDFNISDYLYTDTYDKDLLNWKYDLFFLNSGLDKKELENILFYILENTNIENIDKNLKKLDGKILINIDSPLFKFILKTNNFETNYIINIFEENIDDNYKLDCERLNNSKIKYSIYYNFSNIKKLNYSNFDVNKINYLNFNCKHKENDNLILFDNINNFVYLKYLYIYSIDFHENDKIELNNLKLLSFQECENINLSNISCPKLDILYLRWNYILNKNERIKFV